MSRSAIICMVQREASTGAFEQAILTIAGLGLAICKKLCTLMGGTIHVASELGQGSDFFFDLPFREVPQQGTIKPTDVPEHQTPLHGRRVVILGGNQTLVGLVNYYCGSWQMQPQLSPPLDANIAQPN